MEGPAGADMLQVADSTAMTRARRVLALGVLTLLALLAAIAIWDAALRVFFPNVGVAEGRHYQADASRLWARRPNSVHVETHPDSGASIPVVYNGFGMRQSREFDAEALRNATNVAFFGDSFLENIRIRAAYSFTESLDFLLNLHDGAAFNVLNFGVGGYGPGQQFVWYRQFEHRDDLDHVVYVFNANDIEDFHRHGLFFLNESGHLVANTAHRPSSWESLLSRLHLTFMELENVEQNRLGTGPAYTRPARSLLEVKQRVMRRRQEGSAFSGDAVDDAIAAFQALLTRWKHEVEAHGGKFHVALLPDVPEAWVQETIPAAIDIVDLHGCFSEAIPNYSVLSVRFDKDRHWNERGNMVAAHCLHRFLEQEMGLPPLSDDVLAQARYEFYRAVAPGGWMPSLAWATRLAAMRHDPDAIRAKYLALDWRESERLLRFVGDSLVPAQAAWNVHHVQGIAAGRGSLVYVKAACGEEDLAKRFFLHVFAASPEDLPPQHQALGYMNLDFGFAQRGGTWYGGRCVVGVDLPAYAIAVRTGQYSVDNGKFHQAWKVEIAADETLRQ